MSNQNKKKVIIFVVIIFLLLVLGTFLFYFKNLWPDKLNQVQNQIRESDSLNTIESDIQNSEQYLNNSDQDLENDFGEVDKLLEEFGS